MTKSGMNLQDSFLNQVRKENTEIMLMLLDGTRLNGYVRGFDNFTVIMNVRGSQHLIYKHAIAQIVSRRITHGEGEREGGHGGQSGSSETAPAGASGEAPPAAPTPQEGAPRREREGGYREREREGSHREGGPREGGPREGGPREGGPRESGPRREREEGSHRENGPREGGPREGGPREGGAREGGPREGGPRREREEGGHSNKPKFNTIDFSSIKFDQEKQEKQD